MFTLLQRLPRSKWGFYCLAVLLHTLIAITASSFFKALRLLGGAATMPLPNRNFEWISVVGTALISPLAETVALVLLCEAVKRFARPSVSMQQLVTLTGIVFGLLHGINGLEKILAPFLYFMTFSYAYLLFKQQGFATGFLMSTSIHCTQNSLGLLAIWASSKG